MKKNPKPLKKRIDAMPDEMIAKALRVNRGLQTLAADSLAMGNSTISERIKESPYLQEVVEECRSRRLDKAERALSQLVESEDEYNLGAICFLLKTLGKHRGYIETVQTMPVPKEHDDNVKAILTQIKDTQESLKRDSISTSSEQKS